MGASNHPALRFPKGQARAVDAEIEERKAKAHERQVYAAVDNRDKRRCTCCGRKGKPRATTTIGKLHHDHILELSLGGITSLENVCLLCWICHPYKTQHQLEPAGNPETGTLTYAISKKAAAVVFSGRALPSHVRLMEDPK